MSKSKARFLAELLSSDGKVIKTKSQASTIVVGDLPTIPNSKLANSSVTIAGEGLSLGASLTLDTGDVTEHTAYKYYTDARARASISATGSLSYNSTTGVMSFTMPAQNTSNITEGSNLYFTNARADARIVNAGSANWNTAYGWGNHASAGYTTTDTTYSVQDGELSQNNFTNADHSKLDGIATSANNYSHPSNHAISVITGLQTALNAKVDDSQVLTNVPANALFTDTDTNTTYSVGDGGLSQNNFTNADHSKLNAIEASADVTDSTNVVAALTAGTNITISAGGTIASTDTNTTYSVGDGGLSQNNFTNADHSKLDGIAASANNYVLPSGYATESYVGTQISNLVDSSPAALNTLNELADALGDNENFATDTATAIGLKAPLANPAFTGNPTAPNIRAASGAFHINRGSDGTSAIRVDADGVVVIPTNYFYVSASQGSYFSSAVRFRGTISNDTGTNVTFGQPISVSGTVAATGGNSTNWNTAYTVANAALPKAGGTLTGALNVSATTNARDIKISAGYHLQRSDHHSGHFEGSYNNIGANGAYSNPIYTIGSAYNPASTTLGNMYGIGYSRGDASFLTSLTGSVQWGMYVAGDGDARIWLGGTDGIIKTTGDHYVGSNLVHHNGNSVMFTSADNTKLDGIATGANNYTLPFTNNSSNWNTAYGWGNHASGGYAPASTTTTANAALPKAGGTMSGTITGRDFKPQAGYHFQRSNHHSGHLEGSYNNVAANSAKSNPIYTIGSSYNPTDASVAGMYGIGYAHSNLWGTASGKTSGWGQYVVEAGAYTQILSVGGTWSLGEFNRNGNKVWDAGNDGAGSGLDADLLDGQQGSYYAPGTGANYWPTSGSWWASNMPGSRARGTADNGGEVVVLQDNPSTGRSSMLVDGQYYAGENGGFYSLYSGNNYNLKSGWNTNSTGNIFFTGSSTATRFSTAHGYIELGPMNTSYAHIYTDRGSFYFNKTTLYAAANLMWTAGNDGAGSGLDADLLDGQQGSYYYAASNPSGYQTGSGTVAQSHYVSGSAFVTTGSPGSVLEYQQASGQTDTRLAPSGDWHNSIRMGHGNPYNYYSNTLAARMTGTYGDWYTQTIYNNTPQGWRKLWSTGNDGSGSGLDADLLDGYNAEEGLVANSITKRDGNINIQARRFIGGYSLAGDGQASMPFKLAVDQNSWMVSTASDPATWGLFWAGSSGARYGTNGNGGPGNIWGNSGNPNEFCFVGGDSTAWTVQGSSGDTWQKGTARTADQGILWGASNDGAGSGLDADLLDGLNLHNTQGTQNSANTVLRTQVNGYSMLGWINTTSGVASGTPTRIYCSQDSYIRYYTPASLAPYILNQGSTKNAHTHPVSSITAGTFTGTFTMGNQQALVASDFGHGVFGRYSATRYQHVWSMGTAYKTNASGTSAGNMYGLTYTHTNIGTGTNQAISGLSHQLQHRQNGVLNCAFGTGIWTSGNVTAYSDIAVKTNLVRIPNALEKVCSINGYTYERTDYVKDLEDPEAPDILRQAGVVAQEIEKVLPEVVSGKEGNKAVAYGNIVALLIESIKELKDEVDELKKQLEAK